ncbi:hypothetical protein PF550_00325 [Acinetobacter baumannii]|nr:hypothetical protein [Acinetobacter baumannii]WBS78463.1 hypothetical protein PF557_00325 [Acinetobacter baumannii]WBS83966.1 hypothetical protein PF575_00550 [Acinetobacter baumannii]WBS85827.1 hypothetical protein PF550_00325 [Acinetobacter baumannii]
MNKTKGCLIANFATVPIILGVTYHVLYKPRMKRLGRELVNDH